jgi:hypothetical protein
MVSRHGLRRAHILRRNKANEFPRHFIFFDTETDEKNTDDLNEKELVLKFGCAAYCRADHKNIEWFNFKTIEEFWEWVFLKIKSKKTFYLVAHNLPFDFRILKGFAETARRKFIQTKLIYEGTTNIFVFEGSMNRRLVFIDNMNFFKLPLKILGENIGLPKLEMDNAPLEKYCRRDVEIMVKAWDILKHFIVENNLGNFKPTIAGQAFNAYRHRFMNKQVYIHIEKEAIAAERLAYHGGRAECFKLGKLQGEFHMFDVNSMYPYQMSRWDYPVKLLGKTTSKIFDFERYCYVSKVRVNTGKENVFPLKLDNKKLVFPRGTFDTYLTTRELEYALKNSMVKKVYFSFVYRKANIFTEYVKFFYDIKQRYGKKGNGSFQYVAKLFLNTLYGKFGQRNNFYMPNKMLLPFDGYFYDTATKQMYRRINGMSEKYVGWREGFDSFVAIPAHITADARMYLWEMIKNNKRVVYCDTDSIITARPVKTSEKLGGWSLKKKAKNLIIYGNKDYVFGKDIVTKGIKKNAVKNKDGSYTQVQFEGIAGAIRNDRVNQVFIRTIKKTLKRKYDKGIVRGKNIIPYTTS